MKNTSQKNEILYAITKEDVQLEARRILGRELDDREILQAKKHLEFGIGESINSVYNCIFNEIIRK
ncbi:MAG: hypothetical protein FJ264_05085 [Planctomycetes bacterium]|nr:hypothetical protein [Planctomycetota bacterium]